MQQTSGTDRRPRGPGVLYTALGTIMLVLVGVFALSTVQPPPPSIAEFAPQAVEQITDAPDEQSSRQGGGANGSGEGADATPTPAPGSATTVDTIDVPRVRRCIGDPPRQTEDPQSPPCVPYWKGDNGGATHKGVTGNEIKIAVPSNTNYLKEILAHFNSRYEFYGRRLVAETVGSPDDDAGMLSEAVRVDEQVGAFASTQYGDSGGKEFVYYDELARRRIISVNGRPGMATEAGYKRNHPYQWSYLPGVDVMLRNKAEWICRGLANRPPRFAGGRERLPEQRQFGLVVTVKQDGTRPDTGPMKEILSACGAAPVTENTMTHSPGDDKGLQEGQNVVIDLQSRGVTTVICVCHTQSSGLYMYPNATKQGYNPEWLISTFMYQDEDVHAQFWESNQVSRTFGISWWSKQLPPHDNPWYRAVKEGNPDREFDTPYHYYDARWLYNSMLTLASGIQMAGPNLTPQSFGTGLQKAAFANPKSGRPPDWQAELGFRNSHSAVNDAAIVWMSASQRSNWYPGGPPGAVCWADGGRRYRTGTWPEGEVGVFSGSCY